MHCDKKKIKKLITKSRQERLIRLSSEPLRLLGKLCHVHAELNPEGLIVVINNPVRKHKRCHCCKRR